SPSEGGVEFLKTPRHGERVDPPLAKRPGDGETGVAFIIVRDLRRGELAHYRDGAAEMVRLGCPETGQFDPGLGKNRGVERMGVAHPADPGKLAVEDVMGRGIRR